MTANSPPIAPLMPGTGIPSTVTNNTSKVDLVVLIAVFIQSGFGLGDLDLTLVVEAVLPVSRPTDGNPSFRFAFVVKCLSGEAIMEGCRRPAKLINDQSISIRLSGKPRAPDGY